MSAWDGLPTELWDAVYETAVYGNSAYVHAAIVEYASMNLICEHKDCDYVSLPGDIWCRWHGPNGEENYYDD